MPISSRTCNIVYALCLLATAACVLRSFRDVNESIGVDLRNRVVGARVMAAGHDPYRFVWSEGMPDSWLDPYWNLDGTPRLTAPPTVLCLYLPTAWMPYRWVRNASCALEWAMAIASVLIMKRSIPGTGPRLVFLLFATLCVLGADFWRIHVERGQIYVFHTLPLCLGIAWSLRDKRDSVRAGIAFGIAAALRPNLGLIVPGLFVLGRRRSALAATVAAVACASATLPWAPIDVWKNYLAMGDRYYQALNEPDSAPKHSLPPARPVLEGYATTENAALNGNDHPMLTSAFAVWLSSRMADVDWARTCKLGLAALAIAVLAALALVRIRERNAFGAAEPVSRSALALLVAGAVATEFFLPQRWSYCDVILLALVGIAWPWLDEQPLARLLALVLAPAWILGVSVLPPAGELLAATWRPWGTVVAVLCLAAFQLRSAPRLAASPD